MPVAFVTNHEVENSSVEAVAIVGSTPELGRWKPKNARIMYEVTPGVWETILYLTKGLKFRYKFVVVDKIKGKVSSRWYLVDELKLKTGEFVGSYMLESPPLRLKFVSTE